VLFTGEYEHTIDAKQRLAIPADIRSRLDPKTHGSALYLTLGANLHLWLWPEKTFERMAGGYESSLLKAEEVMEFEEILYSQASRLDLDNAGRVRLPERMLAEAGLGQTVVILGVKDHLELRDPEQWKASRQQKLAKQAEIMLRARNAMVEKLRRGEKDSP
jgi:MraZ protein